LSTTDLTPSAAGDAVEHVRRDARDGHGWNAWLARTGLVAKGISFGIVGALAIALAAGAGGKATSRQGALHSLAGSGLGKVLLILLALGFAAYAAWRVVQAIAARPDDDEAKEHAKVWGKRAGYLGRAAIYAGLTYSTIAILVGAGGGESQNEKAHKTTGMVLSWPAGRWLVGAAALVAIGVGLWNLYRGISRKFEDKWVKRSGAAETWGGRAGVVGHIARCVVFTLIGIFAIKAAVDYDPHDAVGLDGALQKLAHQPYGSVLLGVTAAGLVAYAVYCFVDARYRDVTR
jgi:hypothetical protein